jgi:hypothetical protein
MTSSIHPASSGNPGKSNPQSNMADLPEADLLRRKNFVDILTTIDSLTLAQMVLDGTLEPGTADQPTILGSYADSGIYITLTAKGASNDNYLAGNNELTVKAAKGSWLHFSLTTFDNSIGYTAYLYEGSFSPFQAISPLRYLSRETVNYFPPTGDPTAPPLRCSNHTSFCLAGVTGSNQIVQCMLSFALVDNANGSILGYFCWDSFLRIV